MNDLPDFRQSLAAERTRKGADNLIRLLDATPDEKLHWKPLGLGRSAAELATECVLVNHKWSLTLRQGTYTRIPPETIRQIEAGCEDTARLRALLRDSADELAGAILSFPSSRLDEPIIAPFGEYTADQCCLLGYWNMAYHEGQINYIQTLYGDTAAHAHY